MEPTDRLVVEGFYKDDGWYVPEGVKFGTYFRRHAEALVHMLPFVPHRDVVVQAGGHCGAYPKWLSNHFETVYTFEIEYAKFACLVMNCRSPKVFATRAALSNRRGTCLSGNRRADFSKDGPCPMMAIDDMELPRCDLIALDLDGSEVEALIGAHLTIARYLPIVLLEDGTRNKEVDQPQWQKTLQIMEAHRYEVVGNCGPDWIWRAKG